jgi:hypothetical protein
MAEQDKETLRRQLGLNRPLLLAFGLYVRDATQTAGPAEQERDLPPAGAERFFAEEVAASPNVMSCWRCWSDDIREAEWCPSGLQASCQ